MNTKQWLEYYTTHPQDFDSMINLIEGTILKQASQIEELTTEVARLTPGCASMQADADRKSLIIFAKEQEITELTRMLFAIGKQDGQKIRELTEENRGLRQMLHMEPR